MENINDLLKEISDNPKLKFSDKQLAQIERLTKYTKDDIITLYNEYQTGNLNKKNFCNSKGIGENVFAKWCKRYGLKFRNSSEGLKKCYSNRDNTSNIDIINGMSPTEWSQKHNRNIETYYTRKSRLRKKGLVE